MAPLHSIPLFLQPAQIRKLQSGSTIRLSPDQYGGPHELLVPKGTYNRIMRAQQKGRGVSLHLSDKHIRDNIRSGKGIFDSILNKAKDLAKQHLPGLIDKGVNFLREKAGTKLPQSVVDAAAKYGRDFIRDKTGYGVEDAFGELAKRRRERGGFISDRYTKKAPSTNHFVNRLREQRPDLGSILDGFEACSKSAKAGGGGLSRAGGGLSRVGGNILQDELTTNLHLRH